MTYPSRCFDAFDEAGQVAVGRALAGACSAEAVIFLHGELGAGKTTLTRGVLRGLGYEGAVKSPTYTLVEPYELPGGRVNHLDLYRVADPGELEYLGLDELLAGPAITLIEWPERGTGWLPPPDLEVWIDYAAEGRTIRVEAVSMRGEAALRRLPENLH